MEELIQMSKEGARERRPNEKCYTEDNDFYIKLCLKYEKLSDWVEGSVGKELVMQAWGLEFESPEPM